MNRITKANTYKYSYDAAGKRISKTIYTHQQFNNATIYARDASGNVMSIYSKDPNINQGQLTQNEVHLYGSSRLGIVKELTIAPQLKPVAADFGAGKLSVFTRGEKRFELSNHLGNVLATVSDKKLQEQYFKKVTCGVIPPCTVEISQNPPPNEVDLWQPVLVYNADVRSASDYPFPASCPLSGFCVWIRHGAAVNG